MPHGFREVKVLSPSTPEQGCLCLHCSLACRLEQGRDEERRLQRRLLQRRLVCSTFHPPSPLGPLWSTCSARAWESLLKSAMKAFGKECDVSSLSELWLLFVWYVLFCFCMNRIRNGACLSGCPSREIQEIDHIVLFQLSPTEQRTSSWGRGCYLGLNICWIEVYKIA